MEIEKDTSTNGIQRLHFVAHPQAAAAAASDGPRDRLLRSS